jgi:hypothetical protein
MFRIGYLRAASARFAPFQTLNESVFGVSLSPLSQVDKQQADHGHLDQRFAGLHLALIVNDQTPVTKQPRKCSLMFVPRSTCEVAGSSHEHLEGV